MDFTTILVCIKTNGVCRILMLIKINEQSRGIRDFPQKYRILFFFPAWCRTVSTLRLINLSSKSTSNCLRERGKNTKMLGGWSMLLVCTLMYCAEKCLDLICRIHKYVNHYVIHPVGSEDGDEMVEWFKALIISGSDRCGSRFESGNIIIPSIG